MENKKLNKEFEYYKLKGDNYSSYHKGKIYHKDSIGGFIYEHPEDWKGVPNFPSNEELIKAIEGKDVKYSKKIISILKKWGKNQP